MPPDNELPRWIVDLETMELFERQPDNSYRVAYTLKQLDKSHGKRL
jgi:hypothetical protein